ncbi:adenine(58)-N(1)-methyltransferase non-catalytic subunit TRM6 [Thamnocephalis sphaerospora]|uniref:tRNA (adenine(58)-N(1))-methyltransferase non-catalytic subunit TRM6 n=1 Tax=Thamnocephalis sphaerospora TaxID=78915 RepID=A0A4P9XSR6_9FUNG|nr:adenine(58)-N(1)-methyltransferase non-catalytic subunit TRM6 [Thamnocephalis sphaerospora]|eukprot:RKP09184.1 adenine(58)-N(1)-methyltransferase non-catalytic subunit TRM6 [Thamnocephalis sphaerospora]
MSLESTATVVAGDVVDTTPEAQCDAAWRVREDQYTFIRMPSGNTKVLKLQRGSVVSLGKFGAFKADDVLGKPFGLSYEVVGKRKLRVVRRMDQDDAGYDSDANNREIGQDGTSQQLSQAEIEQMKRDGLEGSLASEMIIQKVAENNQSFEKKTEYSKAKYIKRKQQKFSKLFTPIRPTLATVCDHFFAKNPGKIMDMRIDSLSQLLTFGNVHAGGRFLVVDDAQGMLVSAVLDRMGGHGEVLAVHSGENHNFDVMRYLNYPRDITAPLRTISWGQITPDLMDEDEMKLRQGRRMYLDHLLGRLA